MRAAHSIKGAARSSASSQAVQVAHAMEDCFVAAQKGDVAPDQRRRGRAAARRGRPARASARAAGPTTGCRKTILRKLLRRRWRRCGPAASAVRRLHPPAETRQVENLTRHDYPPVRRPRRRGGGGGARPAGRDAGRRRLGRVDLGLRRRRATSGRTAWPCWPAAAGRLRRPPPALSGSSTPPPPCASCCG